MAAGRVCLLLFLSMTGMFVEVSEAGKLGGVQLSLAPAFDHKHDIKETQAHFEDLVSSLTRPQTEDHHKMIHSITNHVFSLPVWNDLMQHSVVQLAEFAKSSPITEKVADKFDQLKQIKIKNPAFASLTEHLNSVLLQDTPAAQAPAKEDVVNAPSLVATGAALEQSDTCSADGISTINGCEAGSCGAGTYYNCKDELPPQYQNDQAALNAYIIEHGYAPRTSECANCEVGKYDGSSAGVTCTSCDDCASGTYADETGLTECKTCVSCVLPGVQHTACTTSAPAKCTCPAGYESQGSDPFNQGTTTCKACPSGQYSSEVGGTCTACTSCPTNAISSGTCPATHDTRCHCDAGTFSSNGNTHFYASESVACEECDAGSYAGAGATECQTCAADHYSAAKAESCTACPTNSGTQDSTAPFTSVSACQCKSGFPHQNSDGSCSSTCPAGTKLASGSCSDCGSGKYSSGDVTECASCQAGTYSAGTAATACASCHAGSFSAAGATECTSCAAGTYSADAATGCTSCVAGTYSSGAAATACASCEASSGLYSTGSATECRTCTGGKYSIGTGCTDCPAGKYSDGHVSECAACGTGQDVNDAKTGCVDVDVGGGGPDLTGLWIALGVLGVIVIVALLAFHKQIKKISSSGSGK